MRTKMGSGQVDEFITCTVISEVAVKCNGTIYEEPEKILTFKDSQFWIYVGIYTGLVLLAGLMSGLTMGLLSLDMTTLAVLSNDPKDPKKQKYAKRIMPLVSRHHLLLVTLLLANAAAVEAMPIFLDKVSDPITAIIVSVSLVLIFGEVLPQAVCTRFGLAIGATLSPFVYLLMGALFIIAWPISKLLDCLLGEEHGTFYRRAQLKVLVELHGENGKDEDNKEEHLTLDEVLIIKGALDMKFKTAATAMVPISNIYMISFDSRLDFETMTHIMTRGHSRVPVYCEDRSNVVGLLLTKTLIRLNPEDAIPVSEIIDSNFYARPAMFVDEDMPLFDLLNQFQTGKSHLAMVRKKKQRPREITDGGAGDGQQDDTQPLLGVEIEIPVDESDVPEIVGIITLEDVIEELLQEEISDETDMQTVQEMSGLLQVAMAKAVSTRKTKLHRSKSQPQATSLVTQADVHVGRQLSSSNPDHHEIPHDLGELGESENPPPPQDDDDESLLIPPREPPRVTFE